MTVPSKLTKPDGPGSGRRSTRISIAIPITISGKDANGRAFKENTRTIILNKHGAKIVTVHQLALGAEVLLENRALGRAAQTTVAWLGDRPSAREPAEVGIQLVEAENIWGIELPPDDWQEGPPPREARKETGPATRPPAAAKSAAAHAAVPAVSATAAAPGPHPAAVSLAPSPAIVTAAQPSYDALAQDTFKRLASQSDELIAGHLRKLEATLTQHSQQLSAQVQATLQEAASQYEKGLEKATQHQLGEAERQLATVRAEMEALHTRVQELQRLVQSETERSQHEVRTISNAALQSASDELKSKLSQGLGAFDAKVEEHRAELTREMGSTLEEFKRKSETLLEDVQTRLNNAFLAVQEKAPGIVLESLERTSKEFVATLGKDLQLKASSSLVPLLDELREAGAKVVEESRKKLSTLGRQAQEGLEKEATGHAEEHIVRFRKQIEDFQKTGTLELEDRLTEALEKGREAVLGQFQTQLEQAFSATHEKSLAQFRQSIREELLRQFEAAAAEFDKRTQENLELFTDQLNEKKEEIVTQAAEMFRKQIGQMFLTPQSSLAKSSEGEGSK